MEYSIDTSVMIEAWRRHYPPDIFPKWWQLFEEAIDSGIARSSEIILINDLSKKDDDVYAWAKNHKNLFIPIDDKIQIEVSEILISYPRLVENKKGRSASDPFVIALAKLNNAIVVTCEKPTNKIDKPNIPDVCRHMNIKWIDLVNFMRKMKWRFS